MAIHWKAVEQYFTVVLFVFQFYLVCSFTKFINLWLITTNLLEPWFQTIRAAHNLCYGNVQTIFGYLRDPDARRGGSVGSQNRAAKATFYASSISILSSVDGTKTSQLPNAQKSEIRFRKPLKNRTQHHRK